MAKYALIRGGEVVGFRDLEDASEISHKIDKSGDGGPFARLVVDSGKPDMNPLIEILETGREIGEETVKIIYAVKSRDLATVKADLSRRIDRRAESERLKHITPGTGQALEYACVVNEVHAFHSDPNGAYPLLDASVDAGEAKSLAEAADLVLSKSAAWAAICADIRKRRLVAKRGIEAAGDVYAAFSAYASSGFGGVDA